MSSQHTPALPAADLESLQAAFPVGDVLDTTYLTAGLMNRNWRVTTSTGTYALKQITDVPLNTARRNLQALTVLAASGVPACAPVITADGDLVAEIGDRGYSLQPWIDGTHLEGHELTLDQAQHFGVITARIHQGLQDPRTGLPALEATPTAKVTHPDRALADADRYQAAARAGTSPFDAQVAELIDHRKTLIDKHALDRPRDDCPLGPHGWTHGDLQPANILWNIGVITAVIDWDRIRMRPYTEEIARTATIVFSRPGALDLPRITAFASGYRTVIPIDDQALLDGVHRLWWKRISDFWHLDFHYERDDHGCDDLFIAAEAVLNWWTDHRSDVDRAFAHVSQHPATNPRSGGSAG